MMEQIEGLGSARNCELIEGLDFIYEDEIPGILLDKLQKDDPKPEDLLVCGYSHLEGGQSQTQRQSFWAMTLSDYELAVKDGVENDPFSYAITSSEANGGEVALDIYKPELLMKDVTDKYHLPKGVSLNDIRVATIIIRS